MATFSSIWNGRFEDDECEECCYCNQPINPGEDCFVYKDIYVFCSEECIGGHFLEQFKADFDTKHLYTAYEKEMIHADRELDRRRDEGEW